MLSRIVRSQAAGRSIALTLLVVAAAAAFVWPLVHRGIILSDEGYLLQQALDLLGGRVLYRDMDAFITPGMWFLLAGVFALFEPSLLASRVLMLFVFAVQAWLALRIVTPLAGRAAACAAVALLCVFAVWAFPAWTFAFYSPLAVLSALFALERLLAWSRSGRRRELLLVGVALGLAIVFKQNYGVFASLGALAGYGALRAEQGGYQRAVRDIALVAAATAAVGAPFVVYLLATGALDDAWRSLVVHPFEFAGKHDIAFARLSDLLRADLYNDGVEKLTYLSYPFLRAGPIALLAPFRGVQRLHVLAYWLPLGVLAAGLLLALRPARTSGKRIDGALFAVVAVTAAVFAGVLPRADWNHLVNVYQPVLIAAVVVAARAFARLPAEARGARAGLAAALAVLVLPYAGVAASWYVGLLRTHVLPVQGPRGGVFVDEVDARRLDTLLRTVAEETAPGSALLTVPDLVMLNFLAEREVPSAYYNLYEHHIAADRGAAVVAGSEANGVELVVTRFDNFFSDRVGLLDYAPLLSSYLITHFERSFIGGEQDYVVYRRRAEPLAEVPHTSALADCHSEAELADVRHHLLFSALYHRARLDKPIPHDGLVTRCRVHVPGAESVLSLELGYLRPFAARPGTQLLAEVFVDDGGAERALLHRETIRVVPTVETGRQQRFDHVERPLGEWAGREIELVFRTRLRGAAAPHPLDWKGFAMVYRDPRVQSGPGGARP